jgi:hypothetical protein
LWLREQKKRTAFTAIIALILVLAVAIGLRNSFSIPTYIGEDPSSFTITGSNRLQQVNVTYTVSNVHELSSWQLQVVYDPSQLQYESASSTSSDIFPSSKVGPLIDSSSLGTVTLGESLLGFDTANGTGNLVSVQFGLIGNVGSTVDVYFNVSQTYLLSQGAAIPFQYSLNDIPGGSLIPEDSFQYRSFFLTSSSSGTGISTPSTLHIYFDSACTNAVPSDYNLDWGTVFPGQTYSSATFYFKSTDSADNYLALAIANWNPLNASKYVFPSWSYRLQMLKASGGNVLAVYFTVTISSDVAGMIRDGVSMFTFNFVVSCNSLAHFDINGDHVIDIKDISFVAKLFGVTSSSPNWDARADLNGDNRVDIKDLSIIAHFFGGHY